MELYNIWKYEPKSNKWIDLGKYPKNDIKVITKGYKFNGLFYERKNSMIMFDVKKCK